MDELLLKHPQQLAPILRALRLQAGLSQADLAARLGISHQAVSQLEQRPERVTVERLMRVLAVLRVDLALRPRADSDVPAADGGW